VDGGAEPEGAHEVHGECVVAELVMSYFETDLGSDLVRMVARSLKAPMKSMVRVY
jgi:hypothetical protein